MPNKPLLVLSRRLGERILIGDTIEVVVADIDQRKVRLGIHAPKYVPIWREELAPPPTPPGPRHPCE